MTELDRHSLFNARHTRRGGAPDAADSSELLPLLLLLLLALAAPLPGSSGIVLGSATWLVLLMVVKCERHSGGGRSSCDAAPLPSAAELLSRGILSTSLLSCTEITALALARRDADRSSRLDAYADSSKRHPQAYTC